MKQMESSVRKVDGHYEVGILWKNTEPWLPENRQMAEARLQSLKRKLERNEHLHRKYRDFMNNLVAKGYARKLTAEEAGKPSKKTCPFKVPPEDSEALRFLWWESGLEEQPSEFQMTTHIFGATDSPSCANYCLKRAAEDNKERYSETVVNTVKNDFYVDDLVKSVKTEEAAKSLATEITTLLGESGFRLTKWMSNSREVLAAIPEGERAKPTLDLDLDNLPIQRILGVQWDVEKDAFLFMINEPQQTTNKARNSLGRELI
ncbi:hypothetical protein QZH41_008628, partial [Actinostola sp. cb2023]